MCPWCSDGWQLWSPSPPRQQNRKLGLGGPWPKKWKSGYVFKSLMFSSDGHKIINYMILPKFMFENNLMVSPILRYSCKRGLPCLALWQSSRRCTLRAQCVSHQRTGRWSQRLTERVWCPGVTSEWHYSQYQNFRRMLPHNKYLLQNYFKSFPASSCNGIVVWCWPFWCNPLSKVAIFCNPCWQFTQHNFVSPPERDEHGLPQFSNDMMWVVSVWIRTPKTGSR